MITTIEAVLTAIVYLLGDAFVLFIYKAYTHTHQKKPSDAFHWNVHRNYSGMLIGRPTAIMYFLARKITAEGAEERESG